MPAPHRALLAALLLALSLAGAPSALAAGPADPTPVLVTGAAAPPGHRLTPPQVRRSAGRDPRVRAELHRHPELRAFTYTRGPHGWQVSWFGPGRNGRELMEADLDDRTGRVSGVWTGYQVAWTMARGYAGAFGRQADAWYVWVVLSAMFVLPFLRRPLSLHHLDLAALLAFSISLAFFNHGQIGLSVPLAYPPLVYLLVRLLLGAGRGRPRTAVRSRLPIIALAVLTMFLVGFRVALNAADGNVIDVGYAGVIGADRLLHGEGVYGHWPAQDAHGDTYGPVVYLAYVPFRAVLGWSGRWDDLPAAHGAALAFDLLTIVGLFALGALIRGPDLGWLLAYGWAAFPFTLFTLESDSNDSLVALLVVLALVAVAWGARAAGPAAGTARGRGWLAAAGRGIAIALAGLAKFAPLGLVPLFWRGTGEGWRPRRERLVFAAAAVAAAAVVLAPVLAGGEASAFWRDAVTYQADRSSPFSVWGLWHLSALQHLVQGGAVALALALAVVPRGRRGVPELAALTAAVLIAFQLGVTHWFYLYIPWFFAPALVAICASGRAAGEASAAVRRTPAGEGLGVAAPANSGLEAEGV